jgi:hypothetical protein
MGSSVVIKIYKGSKNDFAYTMTAFTCFYGATFIIGGVLNFFFIVKE